jgi:predicted RNA-binding Zn-ribbon protein involved in translation (DUF1610 family)
MARAKYTKEQLEKAVADSTSVVAVMRALDIKMAGGSHSHLSKRIKELGIDTSHFTGQSHNKGQSSLQRKSAEEILIVLPEGSSRLKTYQLCRALLDKGTEYSCHECGISEWNNKSLTLEVDHIDGNWLNNLEANLRFLCPNCHSQQLTNKPHRNK